MIRRKARTDVTPNLTKSANPRNAVRIESHGPPVGAEPKAGSAKTRVLA